MTAEISSNQKGASISVTSTLHNLVKHNFQFYPGIQASDNDWVVQKLEKQPLK